MRKKISRRTFLAWLARGSVGAAAVAAAAQVARFLAFEPPSTEQAVLPLGTPDAYPRNSLTYVAEARVYVVHESSGLYAVDAVCPHLIRMLSGRKIIHNIMILLRLFHLILQAI